MLTRKQQKAFKSAAIERLVKVYFQLHAREVYDGHVHLSDVSQAVSNFLKDEFNMRLTERNKGEVFDSIRDYGPNGEGDDRWLRLYLDGGGLIDATKFSINPVSGVPRGTPFLLSNVLDTGA